MKELFFCFILIFPSLVSAETPNKSFKIAQRTFDVPENWTAQTPSSRMRKLNTKMAKQKLLFFTLVPAAVEALRPISIDG